MQARKALVVEPVSIPTTQAEVQVVLHAVFAPATTVHPKSVVLLDLNVPITLKFPALLNRAVSACVPDPIGAFQKAISVPAVEEDVKFSAA